MHSISQKSFTQTSQSRLERIRALPEHTRKIYMIISMICATAFLGIIFLLVASSLHSAILPSPDGIKLTAGEQARLRQGYGGQEQTANADQMYGENQWGNAGSIAAVGPMRDIINSFATIKNLIMPHGQQDYYADRASILSSWTERLSNVLTNLWFRISNLVSMPFINTLREILVSFLETAASYITPWLDKLIMSLSRAAK